MYLEIITTPQVNVGGVPMVLCQRYCANGIVLTVLCQRCANVGLKMSD